MLIEKLHEHAAGRGERTAIVRGEERLSYGELYRAVMVFAGRLRAAGVGEGDFVCMHVPNGIEFVVAFFGIAAVRGVAIPMDPGLTARERARYLEDLTVSAIVIEAGTDEAVTPGCPVVPVRVPDAGPELQTGTPHDGPVLCQFSSGTTGLSKRVVRTQSHLVHEYRQLAAAIEIRDDDAVGVVVPLHHAHGFGNAMLLALGNGLRLVFPQPPRGADGRDLPLLFWRSEFLRLLAQERVTILPAVPFVFGLLAEAPDSPEGLHLRLCISAGSALGDDVYTGFRERFGTPIRQLYGCTEAGSVTLNTDPDIDATWKSVGRPLPGVELRLEGSDNVIAFRSSTLAAGYHGRSAGNDESFRDGWFRPGDIGRLDDQGRLYVLGRRRSFVKSGGFKVDPGEVEVVLCTHPDVAEAVVFGVPLPAVEEMVKAVVVPRSGASLDRNALFEWCSTRLAGYKQPRILEIRDALPRSALGKVLVRELM